MNLADDPGFLEILEDHDRAQGRSVPSAEPRQSVVAERGLLATLYCNPDLLPLSRSLVRSGDFYDRADGAIFHALCKLSDKGQAIDGTTIVDTLREGGVLTKCGGPAAVLRTLDDPDAGTGAQSAAWHVETAAKRVADYACARRIAERAFELARRAHDWKHDLPSLFSYAREIDKDASRALPAAVDLAHDAEAWCATFLEQCDADAPPGLYVGMPTVDDATQGMRGGELVLVAARPAVGKTALAIAWALNIARRGERVLFFSVEMPRHEIQGRAVSALSGVPYALVRDPRGLGQELRNKVTKAMRALKALPFAVIDVSSINIDELGARARAEHTRKAYAACFVDYAQLVKPTQSREKRESEVREVADGLKAMAKSLDVPVIALAQLNRDVEKGKAREPVMADLRESGSLEQNADRVIFLHREEEDNADPMVASKVKLIFRKQRAGKRDACVDLDWTPGLVRYSDPADAWDMPR